jgi:hypothetical protein
MCVLNQDFRYVFTIDTGKHDDDDNFELDIGFDEK